ncbi:hypothetical protein UVI_02047890 [Ustilaginoidea virens]|uniref:Uncharacterized protein n=1 Tax=Ustilaginoidea virens TaxID=1159556 RepID=A0A1B5L1Z1_USTVR|nr:hypothetical protein UVI_02047890 [Ustilaginoidea virens]
MAELQFPIPRPATQGTLVDLTGIRTALKLLLADKARARAAELRTKHMLESSKPTWFEQEGGQTIRLGEAATLSRGEDVVSLVHTRYPGSYLWSTSEYRVPGTLVYPAQVETLLAFGARLLSGCCTVQNVQNFGVPSGTTE